MTAHSMANATEHTAEQNYASDQPAGSGPSDAVCAVMLQFGRRRIWIASAVVFLAFAFVYFTTSAPFSIPAVERACGQPPPDMRLFTRAHDVTRFLDACGPSGRGTYRNMQLADVFYPAVVGLFLASSLAAVVARRRPRNPNAVWLAVIPLVASSFDYLENVCAWFALARYPGSAPTDALLGYASAAKTVLSWVGGILLVGAAVALGSRFVRRELDTVITPPTHN